jgi:hypothetical protein
MTRKFLFDPIKEMDELENQLSLSKRVGFFFGAGTSMALGIPGIQRLTSEVIQLLDEKDKIEALKDETSTIEDILNTIRLIREITKESPNKQYEGITGETAKKLDNDICNNIYEIISKKENELIKDDINLNVLLKFFSWLNWLSRDYTKEIFTTNYDLVLEKALEILRIPYFDGFAGAYEPFFVPESIEKNEIHECPPISWIRLWKLHGSLGWFWKKTQNDDTYRIIRLSALAKEKESNNELVIYPSKEKYESSRKQPFIAYFDRLKNYLVECEGIFIVAGYSFCDEHINDVIFNGLKQNNRLNVIAFMYSDNEIERLKKYATQHLNLTAYFPKKAIVGGLSGEWIPNFAYNDKNESFWDCEKKEFTLGDFSNLVDFLIENSSKKAKIQKEFDDKDER